MKKLLSILLILCMCLAFTACKNNDTDIVDETNITQAKTECSEQEIRELIERNLDCYFMFFVAPISTVGEENEDGYYKADDSFFADYADMYDFVSSTYTSGRTKWLFNHPKKDKPLYKEIDGDIYVNPSVIKADEYEVAWDEFELDFVLSSNTQCDFTLTTTDFDGKEYTVEGFAVHQGDSWLLTDLVY